MKSKTMLVNYLKSKGATTEEVAEFEKLFASDISSLIAKDALEKKDQQADEDKKKEAELKAQESAPIDISALASEVSIRK